jgi:phosphatidate cytidylyltransferase
MIRIIYFIILGYFILGAVEFFFINREKTSEEKRKSRTKFITYAVIIHILFFGIVINPFVFRSLSVFIAGMGFYELFGLFQKSGYRQLRFFLLSIIIYVIFSSGFLLFSGFDKGLILFSFLTISIFDSFSQITGQLWGDTKIFPKVSPHKICEGLIGGSLVAVFSAFLFDSMIGRPAIKVIQLTVGTEVFAFTGDIMASFYKRKYRVKDISNLIHCHGDYPDRFYSLNSGET